MSTEPDRREHPRHATSLDLQATRAEGGTVARMVTRDLSLGGLYCTSSIDFDEMTRLAVRLMVPGKGGNGDMLPLDVEAVVVRRQEVGSSTGEPRYELALFFVNLSDAARAEIARFVAAS